MHVSASRRHAITDGSFLSGRPSRQTSQAPRHSVDTQTAGRARDAEARGRDGSEGPRTRTWRSPAHSTETASSRRRASAHRTVYLPKRTDSHTKLRGQAEREGGYHLAQDAGGFLRC